MGYPIPNWKRLVGTRVFMVEDQLMHHKFRILDGRDILISSCNWTHRAAHPNEENLVLTTGDPELARHFLREFAHLTGQPATLLRSAC